jgi:hypothetical protein
MGMTADELKDFTMGRKANSRIWRLIEGNEVDGGIWDKIEDNLLKIIGLNRYAIFNARTN